MYTYKQNKTQQTTNNIEFKIELTFNLIFFYFAGRDLNRVKYLKCHYSSFKWETKNTTIT